MAPARAELSADRRRQRFDRNMATAPSVTEERHALVWWWLSEIKKLSPDRQIVEFARLLAVTAAMNAGRTGVTFGDDDIAMPVDDVGRIGGLHAPSGISPGARGQHTTPDMSVTHSNRPGVA